tara:strand:+ start:906 stop:1955 length:1050 start_codon:yes stop_codon:yes gene_type:complete
MAINFGRMARGVATGYLGQKLANTAANDELKAGIIERAGINFYENTLPEFQKKEKSRSETYKKLSARYTPEIAEYMDQEGFITGSANDYANIVKELGANDNFNETKLKSYLETTDAGTYESRRTTRVSDIQDREKFVTGNLESNQIGNMTAKLFLGKDETMVDATMDTAPKTTTEEVTVPGEMVPGTPIKTMDTVETREVPVESKTLDLPSYADIFGDNLTETKETVYTNMKREDQIAYGKRSDSQFDSNFKNDVSGLVTVPKIYKDEYQDLPKEQKNKTSLIAYARDRYLKEVFLPNDGLSYQTKEPSDIIEGKNLINYYNSIGDDNTVEEIKNRLRNKGYNLTDYNL